MALHSVLGGGDDIDTVWMVVREPQLLAADPTDLMRRLMAMRVRAPAPPQRRACCGSCKRHCWGRSRHRRITTGCLSCPTPKTVAQQQRLARARCCRSPPWVRAWMWPRWQRLSQHFYSRRAPSGMTRTCSGNSWRCVRALAGAQQP